MPRRSNFVFDAKIGKLGECKVFGSFFILFNEIFHLSDVPKALILNHEPYKLVCKTWDQRSLFAKRGKANVTYPL